MNLVDCAAVSAHLQMIQLGGVADALELGCHPEGCGQAGGTGQDPHDVQPRDMAIAGPRQEQPHALLQAGADPRKALGVLVDPKVTITHQLPLWQR